MACVLLVDDDDDLRENLEFLLSRRGHAVESAKNGREALDKIDPDDPPRLVIADLMMPVMDGWELRHELKTRPRLAGVRVVICSGVADLHEKVRALDAAEYLVKPVDIQVLYALVDEHC